jgi:hypothetical protein
MGLDYTMSRFIYPKLPDHATKDFLEMVEPIEVWELECKCKYIEGELEICESCKVYFDLDEEYDE